MKRFELDAEQTDAILELKIYRLARLEILVIRNELDEKRKRARQIATLLKDEDSRWTTGPRASSRRFRRSTATSAATLDRKRHGRARVLRRRLHRRGRQRRHRLARRLGEAAEGSEGPVDHAAARGRRGAGGVRRAARARPCVFFSNFGAAYTCRIIDVPASTGYGEPIQKLFKLKDGERVVAALSLDPRVGGEIAAEEGRRAGRPVHAVAVTSDGYSLRFGLEPFVEPSTRPGRRYARPAEGAEVVGVARVDGRRDRDCRHRRGARACCARSTRSTSSRARAKASS